MLNGLSLNVKSNAENIAENDQKRPFFVDKITPFDAKKTSGYEKNIPMVSKKHGNAIAKTTRYFFKTIG